MDSIFDKEIYINIQYRVYEIMENNIKNKKVPNLEFETKELGIIEVLQMRF